MSKFIFNCALDYASEGFKVFPLNRDSKSPLRGSGSFNQATNSEQKIKQLWASGREFNIAIATGFQSNLLVIDVDMKNGVDGSIGLNMLIKDLELPPTRKALTPSGGYHLYFLIPQGHAIKCAVGIRPGVDIRGNGGYIVAPPSKLPEGDYIWEDPKADIAIAPMELINILNNHRRSRPSHHEGSNESISEGGRNDSVFDFCRDIRDQGYSVEVAEGKALTFNEEFCSPPLQPTEVLQTLRSVYSVPPSFDLTDLGNARRLLYLFSQVMKFCDGNWLTYKAGLWKSSKRSIPDMNVFLNHISDELDASDDTKERKAISTHRRSSQAVNKIVAMIQLAESLEGFRISGDQLDPDDYMLGTTVGDINLVTGELLPPSPDRFITKRVNIEYDCEATCPKFEQFLAATFQEDHDLIEYVCKAVGYSLSGSTDEQCFFMLYGSGANGKSVFVNVLSELLGNYGIAAPPGMLVRRNRGQTNDIARLQGKRLLTVSEESSNNTLDEALMKQLTGGDIISARELYKDFVDFPSKVKIWMTANNLPQISDTDNGIKRRIRVIPFNNIVPSHLRDANLTKDLMDELPGILNWALKGHQLWQEEGLGNCKVVVDTTDAYLASQDPVGAWLRDKTITGPEYEESFSDLRSSFSEFADANALSRVSDKALSGRLMSEGIRKRRISKGWIYEGIKLKPKRRSREKAA